MDLLRFLETQCQKKSVGSLTLNSNKRFREVFFEGNRVYLVGDSYCGKIAVDELFAMDVVGKRIPLTKLETIVFSSELRKQLLPDILLDQGLLDVDEAAQVARTQILEEILNLLAKNRASLHFQEGRVPENLLDCQSLVARTPLSVKDLLDEVRRRCVLLEEYESLIPSDKEVLVITETGMAHKQERKGDFVLQHTYDLIDGFRDLRTILLDALFFEFRVLSLITKSLERGYLKKTVHPEIKDISVKQLTAAEAESYLPLFKSAVKYGVDEITARERLAAIYEKLENTDDAVIQYNFIGDALYRMKKAAKAVSAYQRALALKPGEPLILDKVSKIYLAAADQETAKGERQLAIQMLKEALKVQPNDFEVFRQLVKLLVAEKSQQGLLELCDSTAARARQAGDPQFAVMACQHIVCLAPANSAFRKKLVNLYVDLGLTEEAASEMEVLARQYSMRGEGEKAQELLEKAFRLTGNVPEGYGAQPEMRKKQKEARRSKRVKRTALTLRSVLVFLLLFTTYQVWSLVKWNQLESGNKLAVALESEDEEQPDFMPSAEEERNVRLATQCEQFLAQFPASLLFLEAEKLRTQAAARLVDLRSHRQKVAERIVEKGRTLFEEEGAREEAQEVLKPLLELRTGDRFRRKAEELINRCVATESPSANSLLAEGKKHLAMREWKAARRALRQLVDTYPDSMAASSVEIPVLLQSLPSGADVRELGVEDSIAHLGKTPLLITMRPGASKFLQLSLPEHQTLKTDIFEAGMGGSPEEIPFFVLQRTPIWTTDLKHRYGAGLATAPTLQDGLVFGGTSNGKLVCYDAGTGNHSSWAPQGVTAENIKVPPVAVGGRLYTVWNNASVILLNFKKGVVGRSPTLDQSTSFRLQGLTSTPACVLDELPWPIVGAVSGQLEALMPTPTWEVGARKWDLRIGSRPTILTPLSPPLQTGRFTADLLVGTQAGRVLAVDASDSGRILWGSSPESAAITGISLVGNRIAVTTRNGREMSFLEPATGKRVGGLYLEQRPYLSLCPKANKAFALTRNGGLAQVSETSIGQALEYDSSFAWHLVTPPTGMVALSGALGILHDNNRGLLLLDISADGAPEYLWSTSLDSPVRFAVADETYVAVGTEDEKLFLFRK